MSDVAPALRERLANELPIGVEVLDERTADRGATRKALLRLGRAHVIEAVLMGYRDRVTVCVSSQAGCAMGCTFCATGQMGLRNNLTAGEIAAQVVWARREAAKLPASTPRRLGNVVFMGMGEPLLNYENLITTLEILYRNLAPRRITVSTSGIIPGIEQLAQYDRRPNLAISVNAPDRKRREEIMPITAKYPLEALMDSLRRFPLERGRDITIEYVLLAGYNDSPRDAAMLAKLIRGIHAKVNAIPFNEDVNLPSWMKRPTDAAIDRFVDALVNHGVRVTVRRSKGRDIAAACGQLRGKEVAKSRATGGKTVILSREDGEGSRAE
jgi:23S rRNA (adenine2503-C2)-methyltransferase